MTTRIGRTDSPGVRCGSERRCRGRRRVRGTIGEPRTERTRAPIASARVGQPALLQRHLQETAGRAALTSVGVEELGVGRGAVVLRRVMPRVGLAQDGDFSSAVAAMRENGMHAEDLEAQLPAARLKCKVGERGGELERREHAQRELAAEDARQQRVGRIPPQACAQHLGVDRALRPPIEPHLARARRRRDARRRPRAKHRPHGGGLRGRRTGAACEVHHDGGHASRWWSRTLRTLLRHARQARCARCTRCARCKHYIRYTCYSYYM